MKQYTTLYREGKKESVQNERLNDQSRAEEEKNIVNLYPAVRYQLIEGFGGAFTDAAGYVYSQMPEELRRQFLRDCFSPEGLGYTFGRTSIDSCDFSCSTYQAVPDVFVFRQAFIHFGQDPGEGDLQVFIGPKRLHRAFRRAFRGVVAAHRVQKNMNHRLVTPLQKRSDDQA